MKSAIKRLIILSLIITHIVGCLWLLSPYELANDEPIYSGDYPSFLSRCIAAREFLSRSGDPGGYNPYLRAGYRFPSAMADGERVMQVLVYAFSFLPAVNVFKVYVLIALMSAPFLLYLSGRNFGLHSDALPILLGWSLVLWWVPVYPYNMASFGLVNFILASYLSLYVVSLLYKFLTTVERRAFLLLCLFVPLIVFVHVQSVIILLLPSITIYGLLFRRQPVKAHVRILLIAFLTIALNSPWFVTYIRGFLIPLITRPDVSYTAESATIIPPKHFYEPNVLNHLKTFFTGIGFLSLIFAGFGLYGFRKHNGAVKLHAFSSAFLGLFLLTYFGSASRLLSRAQPTRFKLPMMIFLSIPMAYGISHLLRGFLKRHQKTWAWLALPLLFVLVLPAIFPLLLSRYRAPDDINARLPAGGKQLIEWIRTNTDRSGRILLESNDLAAHPKEHRYYGGHLPDLLPYLTKREFISTTFPKFDFELGFSDGFLGARDVRDYTSEDLKTYFDLYNIEWIIGWSNRALESFMSHPAYISLVDKIDAFYIFRVNRKPSFYLSGSGQIAADYNKIQLSEVAPYDGSVVIKYHWVPSLKTDPPRVLNRVWVQDDPYGFIEILDPPECITVYH